VRQMPAVASQPQIVSRANTASYRPPRGLRAGVRLHIHMLRAEERLPVARQVLHHIGELAPAVVALAGISPRVLLVKTVPPPPAPPLTKFSSDISSPSLLAQNLLLNLAGNLGSAVRVALKSIGIVLFYDIARHTPSAAPKLCSVHPSR